MLRPSEMPVEHDSIRRQFSSQPLRVAFFCDASPKNFPVCGREVFLLFSL
jgi:hypothetical protein